MLSLKTIVYKTKEYDEKEENLIEQINATCLDIPVWAISRFNEPEKYREELTKELIIDASNYITGCLRNYRAEDSFSIFSGKRFDVSEPLEKPEILILNEEGYELLNFSLIGKIPLFSWGPKEVTKPEEDNLVWLPFSVQMTFFELLNYCKDRTN